MAGRISAPQLRCKRDMVLPLKVGGLLASSRSARRSRSYVRSTSVLLLRVPPAKGEMLINSPDLVLARHQQHAHTLNLLPDRGFPIGTGKAQLSTCGYPLGVANTCANSNTREAVLQALKRLKRVKPSYLGALWASKAPGLYGLVL